MENKINLLVVDDEQIVLDSIKKHFRNEGDFEVITRLSVSDGLEVVDESNINIILTDLMMPEIDGLEFIKIIKDKDPDILMIMITGYATINTALQAMQLGAFDYIAKPFTRDELRKVVKRAAELIGVKNSVKNGNAKTKEKDNNQKSIKGIGEHSWIMMQDDGNVVIGVERPFLINIGRIQSVYLPGIGDELRQGSTYFQVFSTDLRSQSLLSPLSGVVVSINSNIIQDPNNALQDPYDDGWLIKIRPSNFKEEVKLMGL